MRFLAIAAFAVGVLTAAPLCPATNGALTPDGSSCVCKTGFQGLGCTQCITDRACMNVNANSRCVVGFGYTKSMKGKTYSCVLGSALQAVFNDGSMGFSCDASAKSCVMAVYKGATGPQGPHVVDCNLSGCSFTDSGVTCTSIKCICSNDCSVITKSLFEESIANKPVVITATSDKTLKVDIQGSPLPLDSTCSASSCELPDVFDELGASSSSTTAPPPKQSFSKALILSLAAVLVLLGGISLALVLFYSSYMAQLRRGKHDDDDADHVLEDPLQSHGFMVPSSGDHFAFQDIGCATRAHGTTVSLVAKFCGRASAVPTDEPKTILHGIRGAVRRGEMLALMGPSGSGKTTLLNCLAGVANGTTEFTGRISLDGAPLPSNFRQVAAYVHQDDCLLATLTVRESIEYSAFLRLPSSMTLVAKQQLVTRVLAELHLTHVADSRIGNASLRGVSGGERRRVSIGMELVTQPQ
ncbi:hypothetical protein As57867_005892, partial [Aphanomyces stellatus]